MKNLTRLSVVGVMGSSHEPHRDRSWRVGEWVARAGYHLLTGGGTGVMAAVSEAFTSVEDRLGIAIGIIPWSPEQGSGHPPRGYPNPWVEIAIKTHLEQVGVDGESALSRNHLNVLSSDVVVVLPGAEGTASEARLALRYGRPCVAYLNDRTDMPDLPPAIHVERTFERVEEFVNDMCSHN